MDFVAIGVQVGEFLKRELIAELEEQEHIDTGTLRNSIDYEVEVEKGGITINFFYERYGDAVNTGVRPERVRIGKAFVKAMEGWVSRKFGFPEGSKQNRNRVWQILTKFKQVGIPTKKRYRGGKRNMHWIDGTLQQSLPRIERMVIDEVEIILIEEFDAIIRKYGGKLAA